MHRLFAALRPPPAMRAALLNVAHGDIPGARWQSDEQLHLTLRFIGEVDRHGLQDVIAAMGQVAGEALAIEVDGVGFFDSKGRPNAIWAAVRTDPALVRLQKSVDRALAKVGIPPDPRAFRPHITLARLGRTAGAIDRWLATHAGLRIPPAVCSHLSLYESALGNDGSVYTIVERYPLG